MPVGELLARTSSRELTEWMAFYQLEPFGVERGDLQAGIIAATVANVNRDPKKRSKPWDAQDFMPEFRGPEVEEESAPALPAEALRRKWLDAVAALGGGKRRLGD